MNSPIAKAGIAAGLLLCASLTGGCAVNPATGQRQLMLVSESQEIAMGQEADPSISAMFGIYEDADLQQYVARLGDSLAAISERPQLPWTFRVVDDPIVNAFALPGGFIYVSRGIMAHFNSEAQLVSVLGHEIGHVTARHSASQMSEQQLAQIGLVAGAVIVPDVAARYGGIAQQALGILFLKFSRDDERQADMLGFRYMTRVGYDPNEMPEVFDMLGRVTEAGGGRGLPVWLSTHPDPGDREQRINTMIAESGQDFTGTTVGERSYLLKIHDLIYGPNPREGFFREQLFLHPDLEFQIQFPADWQTVNQKTAVMAQSPNQDAILQLTADQGAAGPVEAAQEFANQDGVNAGAVQPGTIGGFPSATVAFAAETEQGILRGAVTYIQDGELIYRLLAFSTSAAWSSYQQTVANSVASFARLTDQSALAVQPLRLSIIELPQAMTIEAFDQRYPSPIPIETLSILNQVELGVRMPAGTLVKRVVGEVAR
ncbi:MAG: M48 family metalloprotease [Gemmatimonadota bacterium]|nr:MAG: M48 family metalloprotease [Gemmatimonadota bacterium]